MKVKNYDVHIVANDLPPRLLEQLLYLGYAPQRVVGGDPRVRMQSLLTLKVNDKDAADNVYAISVEAIQSFPAFRGYIEEEAVVTDVVIHGPERDCPPADFPEQLRVSPCPPNTYKKCDIHATTTHADCHSAQKLLEAGFYFLSLDKPGLGTTQICTIQLEDLARGKQLWQSLLDYLRVSGDSEWHVKFEATVNIRNFGFSLPPIVLNESS